ncbi:MAG: PKD repeat protein, partial [Planctomycetota bacterium]
MMNSLPPKRSANAVQLWTALTALGAATLILACSSGLGNNLGGEEADTGVSSANLRTGIDLGFSLSGTESATEGGITEYAVTGGVLPGITGTTDLEGYEGGVPFVFLAFVTDSDIHDPDANGLSGGAEPTLDPEVTIDTNGGRDIVVAALPGLDLSGLDDPGSFLIGVDPRAFVQAVAPSMRHARCVTCHSMKLELSELDLDGDLEPDFGFPLHPGGAHPIDNSICAGCHLEITPDWFAPPLTPGLTPQDTNLKGRPNTELFEVAMRTSGSDLVEHFSGDDRVSWALGRPMGAPAQSGKLPLTSGNGIADNDHDGIIEKEDDDGRVRTVPGGEAGVIASIEAWMDTEDNYGDLLFDNSERGVADTALVSRVLGGTVPGNGDSFAPSISYVENTALSSEDQGGGPVGSLFVAFATEATDLIPGNGTNANVDVYRAEIEVRVNQDSLGNVLPGSVNLTFVGMELVSESAAGGAEASGTSGHAPGEDWHPEIGGYAAELVAFSSDAPNLVSGFSDNNGAAADVFVRNMDTGEVALVSRSSGGGGLAGGDGAATNPSVSLGGRAVVYESLATNLDGGGPADTNGVQDVFVTELTPTGSALTVTDLRRMSLTVAGTEGSGGDSRSASVFVYDEELGDSAILTRVAFESDKTDLVAILPAMTTTSVFMRDEALPSTVLLNQIIAPGRAEVGAATIPADDTPAPATSLAPLITSDGNSVIYETLAENIDTARPDDENYTWDVVVADLRQWESNGYILPYRASVSSFGGDGSGASRGARIGTFAGDTVFPVGLGVFQTEADNLGTSDGLPLVALFISETGGLSSRFTVSADKAGPSPVTLTFTDDSVGDHDTWSWDFGVPGIETDVSSQQNPKYRYTSPGTYTVSLVVTGALGTDTSTGEVRIVDEIQSADFSVAVTSGDAIADGRDVSGVPPFTIALTDLTDDAECPETWSWDLDGDGLEDSTERNPTFTYSTLGTFQVSMVVSSVAGDAPAVTGLMGAYTAVVANFTPNDLEAVRPLGGSLSVTFDSSTSTGDVASYAWDFGAGAVPSTSTAANPTVGFAPGSYAVTLEVTGEGGDTSTDTTTVQVYEQVVASAALTDPANGIGADGVTPYDINSTASTGDIFGYEWFAGDPNSGGVLLSTSVNLVDALINIPGGSGGTPVSVDVVLRLTGDVGASGESNTDSDQVTVMLFDDVSASFTTNPPDLNSPPLMDPSTIMFDASGSSGDVATYEWYDDPAWNPGDTPTGLFATGVTATETFTLGVHEIVLKVTGLGTDTSFVSVPFTIGAVVDFTSNVTAGTVPFTVNFSDLSSGSPTAWTWNFGDGSSSAQQNPSKTYTAAGTYDVTLTAVTSTGTDSETKLDYITANPPPIVADFTASTTLGDAPLSVNFTDLTSGGPTSWSWNFGNGQSSTAQNPSTTYNAPGSYTVSLSATGPGGTDSEVKVNYIVALEPVAADFAASTVQGNGPLMVTFTDTSAGNPTSWSWNFGAAGTSSAQNPVVIFPDGACYGVSLTASRAGGSDTEAKPNFIQVGPAFTAVYLQWQGFSCIGCHGSPGGGNLNLSTELLAYNNLVNVPSQTCSGG